MIYILHPGNLIEQLAQYPDNSFDAIVTDCPYGLGEEPDPVETLSAWIATGFHLIKGKGFMGKDWDAFVPQPIHWRAIIRVLKPGGHVLAFFGTRTYDWGVMAMRFAGFEIRDQIQWIYGSGFPKSMNISKEIDRQAGAERDVIGVSNDGMGNTSASIHSEKGGFASSNEKVFNITAAKTDAAKLWDGWGTNLKPANEPIVLARKPISENTIAENVLKWGTGGIYIEGCRIDHDEPEKTTVRKGFQGVRDENKFRGTFQNGTLATPDPDGRFPANIIFDAFYAQVLYLKENISVDLQELISNYYGETYLSRVQKKLRNISEQGNSQEEILQQGMLSQSTIKKDERGGALSLWETPQRSIKEKNEATPGKDGESKPAIQGIPYGAGLPVCEHGGTNGGTINNGNENVAERETSPAGTPVDNGGETWETTFANGASASQKRCEGRQSTGEPGSNGQFNSQNVTQKHIERTEAIEKAKRRIAIFDTELPEMFKNYFEETGIIDIHFNSAAEMLDEQSGELTSGAQQPVQRMNIEGWAGPMPAETTYTCEKNTGGASRFFKVVKSDSNFDFFSYIYSEIIQIQCGNTLENQKVVGYVSGATLEVEKFIQGVEQFTGGKKSTENYLPDMKSIIEILTKQMMQLKTCNCLQGMNIEWYMQEQMRIINLLMELNTGDANAANYITLLITFQLEMVQHIRAIAKIAQKQDLNNGEQKTDHTTTPIIENTAANKFFYVAKPSQFERSAGLGDTFIERFITDGRKKDNDTAFQRGKTPKKNWHPCVKPITLMRYLIKMITPPGGKVLDPFMGSGTTGCACAIDDVEFYGIDLDPECIPLATARIEYWKHEGEKERAKPVQGSLF